MEVPRARLQTRKWQDKEGNDRYTTEVRGDRVVLLGGGGGGGRREQAERGDVHESPQGPVEMPAEDDVPF